MSCPVCHGTGLMPMPGGPVKCPACGGTGVDIERDERIPIYDEPPPKMLKSVAQ